MKMNQPNPAPVANNSDFSHVAKLRALYLAPAKIARIAAENEHRLKLMGDTFDEKKIRELVADTTKANQELEIEQQLAQNAVKILPATAMIVLGEIGTMTGRILLLNRACYDKAIETARKSLAPFLTGGALQAAAEASAQVCEQRALNDRHSVRPCGNAMEADGKGGARLQVPINVRGLLAGHEDAARCLAAVEERARKLGISLDICAQEGTPAAVVSRRRVISPSNEAHAQFRVELRVLTALSLGYVDGKLTNADPGDILDLPLLPLLNCLASELISSDRVEVISKLPVLPPRKFLSAPDLNTHREGVASL